MLDYRVCFGKPEYLHGLPALTVVYEDFAHLVCFILHIQKKLAVEVKRHMLLCEPQIDVLVGD